jgi:hypothetical protein
MPLQQSRNFIPIAFVVIAAVAFLIYLLTNTSSPYDNDTPSYMYFDRTRVIGYPLFLNAVRLISGSYLMVLPVQLAVLCTSIAFLAISFWRCTGSWRLSLVLELAILMNFGVMRLADKVMSEALSEACIVVFTALVLREVFAPTRLTAVCLVAAAAVAVMVRPVNIALVPAAAAVFLIGRGWRWSGGAKPIAALLMAAFLASGATHFTGCGNLRQPERAYYQGA